MDIVRRIIYRERVNLPSSLAFKAERINHFSASRIFVWFVKRLEKKSIQIEMINFIHWLHITKCLQDFVVEYMQRRESAFLSKIYTYDPISNIVQPTSYKHWQPLSSTVFIKWIVLQLTQGFKGLVLLPH